MDLIIKNVEEMQESQQRLLDEQLQLSLDTNKTGLSISSHDSQIDLLEQYTKVCNFSIGMLHRTIREILRVFHVTWTMYSTENAEACIVFCTYNFVI